MSQNRSPEAPFWRPEVSWNALAAKVGTKRLPKSSLEASGGETKIDLSSAGGSQTKFWARLMPKNDDSRTGRRNTQGPSL